MATRIGMDPEQVRAASSSVSSNAATLDELASQAREAGWRSLNPLEWGLVPGVNLVLSPGSIALAQLAAAEIDATADAARVLLGRLVGEISAQYDASTAGAGYADAVMSKADAHRLYVDALDDPSVLDGLSPLMVKAWWDQLTDAQREEFVDRQTLAAGNLDGIPMPTRAEANRANAIERLEQTGLSADEREYLERVRSGDVILVAYDPAADRIIEAIGLGVMDFRENPDDPTFVMGAAWDDDGELVFRDPPKHVITYVPGTGSNLETFYGEENYQDFAHGLVLGREDESVVFVYKGGPFASGLDEAKNQEFTLETGRTLASFDAAIGLETGISQASQSAIGHSWGLANVTASEVAGARYDNVISLAGAWMPDGWEPHPDTDYSHHSYTDWLRLAQVADRDSIPFDVIGSGNFPGDSEHFARHEYVSPNDDELLPGNYLSPDEYSEAKDAWLDNHELIHLSNDPNNAAATQNIQRDIYG